LCIGIVARRTSAAVLWWKVMSSAWFSHPTLRLTAAATGCLALLAVGLPSAGGVADSDRQGYVDSTARCPNSAVIFGSTASSRVAICKTSDGQYEYRAVRVRDGAKLIVPATAADNGGYTAVNGATTYTVTSSSLVVSVNKQVISEEPMVDFHEPQQSTAPPATAPSSVPTTTTPTTPIKPLPAEVGGSGR
jgi:hypothetical protein